MSQSGQGQITRLVNSEWRWQELIVLSRRRKEWNLVSSVHIYPQCTMSDGLESTQKPIQPLYAHKLGCSFCKEALQHFKGTLPPNITKQHDTAWLQQKCWCRRKLCSLCIWLPLGNLKRNKIETETQTWQMEILKTKKSAVRVRWEYEREVTVKKQESSGKWSNLEKTGCGWEWQKYTNGIKCIKK